MHLMEAELMEKTAERAYFLFLERERLGLPGNERQDWIQAEEETRQQMTRQIPHKSASVKKAVAKIPLNHIKGVGPKVASEFAGIGVTCVSQLADWTSTDFEQQLPHLKARAKSGQWIRQAREMIQQHA